MFWFPFTLHSPVPHQPNVTPNPELLPCEEPKPLVDVLDLDETSHTRRPSVRISQKSSHLEVVVEDHELSQATFYVGESPSDSGSLSSVEESEQRNCLIRTPVDVHSPMETEDRLESQENRVNSEPEMFVISEEISPSPEDVCSEKPDLENHVTFQVYEGQSAERETNSDGSGANDEILLQPEITVETLNVSGAPEVESNESIQEMLQQEVEHGAKEEATLESEVHQKSPNGNNAAEVERSDSEQGKQQEVEHKDEDEILQETLNAGAAPEVEPNDLIQEMLQQEVEHVDKEESPSSNGNSSPEEEPKAETTDREEVLQSEVLQSEVHVETPNVNGAPEVEPDESVQEKHKQEVDEDRNDVLLQSEVHMETLNVNGAPEVEPDESVQEKHQQEVDRADKGERSSLTSSTESIMKCSEEESVCGDTEDSVTSSPEDVRNWSGEKAFNAPELHLNGRLEEKRGHL